MRIQNCVTRFSPVPTARSQSPRQALSLNRSLQIGQVADQATLRFRGVEEEAPNREKLQNDLKHFVDANKAFQKGLDFFEAENYEPASQWMEKAWKSIKQMSFKHPEYANYPMCHLRESQPRQQFERQKLELITRVSRYLGDSYFYLDRNEEALKIYKQGLKAGLALARENNQRIWEAKNIFARIAQTHLTQEDYPTALNTIYEATRELAKFRDPVACDEEILDKHDHLYNYEAEERFLFVMTEIFRKGMTGDKAKTLALETNTKAMNLRQQYDGDDIGLIHLLEQRMEILADLDRYEEAAAVRNQMQKIMEAQDKQDPPEEWQQGNPFSTN